MLNDFHFYIKIIPLLILRSTIFLILRYIIRRIDVLPESRVQYLEEQERYSNEIRGIGPCGGFSTQYACMCDYHTLPYREEVAWVKP